MRLIGLVCLAFLLLPNFSFAQNNPGDKGRFSDGRAYRVDNNGFQIVDHVAELEVTIDDLNKQIQELESQMDKQDGFTDEASGFKEENLIGNNKIDSFNINPTSCAGELEKISILEAKLSSLETQQVTSDSQASTPEQVLVGELSSLKTQKNLQDKEIKSLKDHIAKLQTALMDSPSEESFAKQIENRQGVEKQLKSTSLENENLKSELSQLAAELEEKASQEKELTEKMTDMSGQIAKLRNSIDSYAKKGSSAKTGKARARFRTSLDSQKSARKRTQVRKIAAVDSTTLRRAERDFRASLGRINKLISQRKTYFDKARKVKTIAVSPRPLVSKKGLSLDKLKSRISRVTPTSNISEIRQGLYDIERLLKDDVKVAANVAKL